MNADGLYQAKHKLACKSGILLISIVALVALAGCGKSEPKLGDVIHDQGIELAEIGDQWTEGSELIDEGRDQIEEGQDMINEGQSLLETGNDNVKRGKQAKEQAELSYRQKTGQELPNIQ